MKKSDFQQQLDQIHLQNCQNIQPQQLAVFQQSAVFLARSGIEEQCLRTNESVPDFTFDADWCSQTSLYELLETAPVLLNFFRGFWCTYCSLELAQYNQLLPQLQSKNLHYLAISPQQIVDDDIDAEQYHFVCDRQLTIAKSFGLCYQPPKAEQSLFEQFGLSLPFVNNMETWELPLPATYLIGQDGKVRFRFVNVDYRRRFDPNELVNMGL